VNLREACRPDKQSWLGGREFPAHLGKAPIEPAHNTAHWQLSTIPKISRVIHLQPENQSTSCPARRKINMLPCGNVISTESHLEYDKDEPNSSLFVNFAPLTLSSCSLASKRQLNRSYLRLSIPPFIVLRAWTISPK
jgi:hypothetical protein